MAQDKIIDNISFIDYTEAGDDACVFELADEMRAETIGAFSSEESLKTGIAEAIEAGYDPRNLWGTVYPLDRLFS